MLTDDTGRDATAEDSAEARYAARINTVVRFIEDHLDEALPLERLAGVAHFSAFHFHRQFTAFTGVPVAQMVRYLRMKRAALALALDSEVSVMELALAAGYESPEAFSRAFKRLSGQSPSEYRGTPRWLRRSFTCEETEVNTEVEIVDFPDTAVAAVEYKGPERHSLMATRKLIAWRRENGVTPQSGQTYGVHYTNPDDMPEQDFRLDICVSYNGEVGPNTHDVVPKVIPGGRCARIRHLGSRDYIYEAEYLYREWLPGSGEELRDYPLFFHYVNVGPDVRDSDMITDVYLPLR